MSVRRKLAEAMDRQDAIATLEHGQAWVPRDHWDGQTYHPALILGGYPAKVIRETEHGYVLGPSIPDVTGWTEQAATPASPPVDPMDVAWPGEKVKVFPERTVHHPRSTAWTDQLDVMVTDREGKRDTSLAALYAWAAQRALETRMLEDMAAILKARPADAPGVILFRYPNETAMMESQFIPSGTLIYSMPDQPDLMVKLDPDGPGVLYYRQGPINE